MSEDLWQLFDAQGRPIPGKGATKHDAAINGLLHGVVHVWLWRQREAVLEVLLQRRQRGVVVWPGRLDSSAGGHIYLGEEPVAAALRLAREEIGLSLTADQLCLCGITYARQPVDDTGLIEHEYQWVYLVRTHADPVLHPERAKVQATEWRPCTICLADMADADRASAYTPRGMLYFSALFDAIERVATGTL